jgi:hypothetical protein
MQTRFANISRAPECGERIVETHSRLDKGDKLEVSRLSGIDTVLSKLTFLRTEKVLRLHERLK